MATSWPQIFIHPDGHDVSVYQLRPDNWEAAASWSLCRYTRMVSGGLFLYRNDGVIGEWELGCYLVKDSSAHPYIVDADEFNNSYLPKYPT